MLVVVAAFSQRGAGLGIEGRQADGRAGVELKEEGSVKLYCLPESQGLRNGERNRQRDTESETQRLLPPSKPPSPKQFYQTTPYGDDYVDSALAIPYYL